MTPGTDFQRTDALASSGYVDWAAIFAGTVVALAVSVVLFTFGSAIGLSMVSFEPRDGASLFWLAIVSGLWFIWVAVTSFGAGGYLAGRLRRPAPGASVDEIEVRDGSHGLLVWATGALLGAVLAALGRHRRDRRRRSRHRDRRPDGGRGRRRRPRLPRRAPRSEAPASPTRAAGGRPPGLIRRGLADGELAGEDRDYLARLVAERTDQSPEEAAATVDTAFAEARQLYDAAVETAEQARVATAIAGFLIAATLLVSAAAAYTAASVGGDHRDRGVRFGR